MGILLTGCLAFGFLTLFDCQKLRGQNAFAGILFLLGFALLFCCSLLAAFEGEVGFSLPIWLRLICLLLSLLSFVLMLSALFFVLPFQTTYLRPEQGAVVDTGLYALCRHPGVLFFVSFYFFLWLALGRPLLLWACLVWGGMDVLHVWVQDRFFFPRCIKGYRGYQKRTPFLMPTPQSIRRCFARPRETERM